MLTIKFQDVISGLQLFNHLRFYTHMSMIIVHGVGKAKLEFLVELWVTFCLTSNFQKIRQKPIFRHEANCPCYNSLTCLTLTIEDLDEFHQLFWNSIAPHFAKALPVHAVERFYQNLQR